MVAEDTDGRVQVSRFESRLLSAIEEKLDSPAVVSDSVTSTARSALDVFPGGRCALVGTRQRAKRGR